MIGRMNIHTTCKYCVLYTPKAMGKVKVCRTKYQNKDKQNQQKIQVSSREWEMAKSVRSVQTIAKCRGLSLLSKVYGTVYHSFRPTVMEVCAQWPIKIFFLQKVWSKLCQFVYPCTQIWEEIVFNHFQL